MFNNMNSNENNEMRSIEENSNQVDLFDPFFYQFDPDLFNILTVKF